MDQNTASFSEKHHGREITEENDLENFQDIIVALDACYWLHKAISIRISRFGDDRKCDLAYFMRRFPAS